MRTIKFRAWDTRQKCMQTWEFLNKLCPFEDLFKSKLYSPLMQYTRLTDENIKKIGPIKKLVKERAEAG